MNATDMIGSLQLLVKKHGNLDVFTNENSEGCVGYNGESESAGVSFAKEIDDTSIDEEMYLPNRFYIKT